MRSVPSSDPTGAERSREADRGAREPKRNGRAYWHTTRPEELRWG